MTYAYANSDHETVYPAFPGHVVLVLDDYHLREYPAQGADEYPFAHHSAHRPQGLYLRVTDQPNLDAQPWLVDTGVGKENTRYDATLPAGVERKTLY